MAKAKSTYTVHGKTVEELDQMRADGVPFPEGTCRDYSKNPPYYECENEEQHLELQDVTVVSFGGEPTAAPAEAVVDEDLP